MTSSDDSIVFLSGKRTPFGSFGGSFANTTATELGIHCSHEAIKQAGISPQDIDHVIFGNVVQSDPNSIYAPRHIGLHTGIPKETPALGVNRLCGSGFEALRLAAQSLQLGESQMILAGGIESMSQVPFVIWKARWGQKMGHGKISDYLTDALMDRYCGFPMAETAEILAKKYGISRDDADELALQSQTRTQIAEEKKLFEIERMTVQIEHPKKPFSVSADEHPRPQTGKENLAKLRPAFRPDGMITGGNASGMVDGAGALIMTTEKIAKSRNLNPIGRLVASDVAGVDPSEMGIGPVPALKMASQKAGIPLKDMEIIEVNEAFAPQFLAVQKELELDPERTNVNGGAIAIGHPLGATGARITMHGLYELQRRANQKGKSCYGAVSACIGGGQGIALILESF